MTAPAPGAATPARMGLLAHGVSEDGKLVAGPAQLEVILAALSDAAWCHDHHRYGSPMAAGRYRRLWRRLASRIGAAGGTVPDCAAERRRIRKNRRSTLRQQEKRRAAG